MDKVVAKLGLKYYRYKSDSEDSLEVIRIIGLINNTDVKVSVIEGAENDVTETVMNLDSIEKDYRALIPAGLITFNDVLLKEASDKDMTVDDIIVLFYKYGGKEPSVICRQNVTDFFYQLRAQSEDDVYVGVSVTKDTIPEGIEFNNLLACSGINNTVIFNVYLDDDMKDILKYIKTKKFDHTLEVGLFDHLKQLSKQYGGQVKLKQGTTSVNGFNIDLKTLLNENDFWFDIYNVLGITCISGDLRVDGESLSVEDKQILSDIFRINIDRTFVLKYKNDIDLSEIKMNHMFIRDDHDLYIVAYTSTGEYIEKDLEASSVAERMKESLRHIACNYSKYTE